MVAMNADPSARDDLEGAKGGHLFLVPSAELDVLDAQSAAVTVSDFSQAVYGRVVRECFDEESKPLPKRDVEKVDRLVRIKDTWLQAVPENKRQDAVLGAYNFLIGDPPADEEAA